MRIEYDYGAPGMRESSQEEPKPEKSSSTSAGLEEDQVETTHPLHHQVKSTRKDCAKTNVPFPSVWSTPTKSTSSRVEAHRGENTPATTTSFEHDSLDSSVSSSPRFTHRQYADEVRLSINFQNLQYLSHENTQVVKSKTEVVLQTFGPKFILEVMGGAGAVWGFSEAIGLRTSATVWFWRPVTLFAGVLFFTRWYRQLHEFIRLYDRRTKRRTKVDESAALLFQENV